MFNNNFCPDVLSKKVNMAAKHLNSRLLCHRNVRLLSALTPFYQIKMKNNRMSSAAQSKYPMLYQWYFTFLICCPVKYTVNYMAYRSGADMVWHVNLNTTVMKYIPKQL